MTDEAMLVVKCLFSTIWSIFTSWHIPGTNVTPMAMSLFLIIACLGLRFLYSLLGVSSLDSVSGLVAEEQSRGERMKSARLKDARLKEHNRKILNRHNDKVRSRELYNSGYHNDR